MYNSNSVIDGSFSNNYNNNGLLSSAATVSNFNNNNKYNSNDSISNTPPPRLPSSVSCQEFCAKHNLHHSNCNSTMNLGFHFHLAGFINAENGMILIKIKFCFVH